MTAAIIVFDQFTDIDVFLPWDLLNRVRMVKKDFSVRLLGTEPSHRSINGLSIAMHGQIEEARQADIVFFASGKGVRMLYRNNEYLNRFQLDPSRQLIGSMCSGALLLAGLGLLQNKKATTYPTSVKELKEMNVQVLEDQHLVVEGNVATAAGCLAAIDLVSWMLDGTIGTELREKVIASVLPVGQGQACIY